MQNYRYAVLGAGRQGTAAAHDLAVRGDAISVTIADLSPYAARSSCERVNHLAGRNVAQPQQLDVRDQSEVCSFLAPFSCAVSAVPYYLNLHIAQCAVQAGTSICDLGGHTGIVFQELALNKQAQAAGITIVPDCGMVPGLGTSMCAYAMALIESPEEVFLWDGGLPQRPIAPWNYILTFHFEGLINEYFGTTEFLRDGKLVDVRCFEEYELVDFPEPIGTLEAFTTAGGTSSSPRTFLGKLKTYQNKTLRYQGHFQQWKTLRDAGLFGEEPVLINGTEIRPRDLLKAVLEPQLLPAKDKRDVCIIRATCIGMDGGKRSKATVDLFDYYDPETDFTSMERTTGYHIAIMAAQIAKGNITPGAIPVELAIDGETIARECVARGMQIKLQKELV